MASSRIPPVKREDIPPQHRQIFDDFDTVGETAFGRDDDSVFVWKEKDGGLLGPFPILLSQPQLAKPFLELTKQMGSIPDLPPDAREVAIMATGAHFGAAYELYSHTAIATRQLGMSARQVDAIARGERPSGLSEQHSIAYDVAVYLTGTPGPLTQDLWDRSVRVFGFDGTVALVHFVGFYAYACVLLNAMDAPVPGST